MIKPGDALMDAWAAQHAQHALDLMNMADPFTMLPESEQIKMSYEEKVALGHLLVKQEIKRDDRNRKRRKK